MPLCNDVFRRDAKYYWRKRVPSALRSRLRLTYLIRSLGTHSPEEARSRARGLTSRAELLFAMLKSAEHLTDAEIDHLVAVFLWKKTNDLARSVGKTWSYPGGLKSALEQLEKDIAVRTREFQEHKDMLLQLEVHDLLEQHGIHRDLSTCIPPHIEFRLGEANLKAMRIHAKRLNCEPVELPKRPAGVEGRERGASTHKWLGASPVWQEVSWPPAASAREGVPTRSIISQAPAQRTLADLFKVFSAEHAVEAWDPKTHYQHQQTHGLFVGLLGDRSLDAYEKRDVAAFKEMLQQVPAKYGQVRKYRGRTLSQIVELAKDSPDEERLAVKTIGRHLSNLSAFWGWAVAHGHATKGNIASDMTLKRGRKKKKRAREQRLMFEKEDLRRLFTSPAFTGCASSHRRAQSGEEIVRDAFYWAPLLGAYAGLRLEEACQLRLDDIRQEDGIWVLRVEASEDDQHVKSDASERLVPIHSALVRLGFIERVDALRRKKGVTRVFPELLPQGEFPRYGTQVSKWFTRYRKQIGLYMLRKDFHSLRHSFDTFLQRADAQTSQVAALMGHEPQCETSGRYLKGFEPKQLARVVELLDYEIPGHRP